MKSMMRMHWQEADAAHQTNTQSAHWAVTEKDVQHLIDLAILEQ